MIVASILVVRSSLSSFAQCSVHKSSLLSSSFAPLLIVRSLTTHHLQELLAFAEDLDFDKYADDMELQVLMDKVKDRIGELESENLSDEKIIEILQRERAERQLTAENLVELEADDKGDADERDEADEVKSIAESVRSDASGMREVHSQKSLEQLVLKSKA